MKILFDQNAPAKLRGHLPGHEIGTAREAGWEEVENGELLRRAEDAGFQVFGSCDQSLVYQQNLSGRKIGIVELSRTHWPLIKRHVSEIQRAVDSCGLGSYIRVDCGRS